MKNDGDSALKKPAAVSGEVFWKHVYVILCIILLCLTAAQLFIDISKGSGWDYRVFVGAVQAINHGEDPYFPPNINQYTNGLLPYIYAPHVLLILWFLQFFYIFQSIWIYYAFLTIFLALSSYIIVTLDRKPQYLFFITVLMTCFISTYWNFLTGNKEILFLFLFAGIFHLLIKEKFWQSSIIMGLLGSFTLVPLPFTALYLVIKRPLFQRIMYILLSIGVVAAIFLITWLIYPDLFMSYINTFFGQSYQFNQPSGINTPTPFLMFGVLIHQTNGISTSLILVSLIYICLIIGSSWYIIKKNQEKPLKLYSLAMFAIFMILPRIQPYYFIILAIPLYLLYKDCSDKIKILVLAVISLLPLGVWYYFWLDHTQPISYMAFLVHEYSQNISLFLIFGITIALEYYRQLSKPTSTA